MRLPVPKRTSSARHVLALGGPPWVFLHRGPGEGSAACRYPSSCRQRWLGDRQVCSRSLPAEWVALVQRGEERAGTKKVPNISKSSSATGIGGTAVPDRIFCDCVVFAQQPAKKLREVKEKTWLSKVLGNMAFRKLNTFCTECWDPLAKTLVFVLRLPVVFCK